MNPLKTLWGLLFRLFPCPTRTGLRRIGDPGRDSPVLVTCNFHTTVQRLTRTLRRAGIDAWLLVADSKGVNVWCAAGADELDTRSVVAVLKTSGIDQEVDHRRLMLPPLGAPAIRADAIREQTGWKASWGPVRMSDIPQALATGRVTETMRRVTWTWHERLDHGLGSMFGAWLAGVAGFALFGRGLLPTYVMTASLSFLLFYLLCPWIPGRRGMTKVAVTELLLGAGLAAGEVLSPGPFLLRAELIIAMSTVAVWGTELGGLAPHMSAEFDAWAAKAGIGAIGNTRYAGTLRAELLTSARVLVHHRDRCGGCRRCAELCPQGVWRIDDEKRAVPERMATCTACTACVVQCGSEAIEAAVVDGG